MPKLPNQPIPTHPSQIVLINPTKYLGNLLLSGGLIQDFAAHCRDHNQKLVVVLDAAFKDLCSSTFREIDVLWYPRRAIRQASNWRKLVLGMEFVLRLRRFRADLAFNIEEDSLTSRLTQLSGARYRLGCSPARQRFAYEHVLPIQPGDRHRWFSYRDVFVAVGMPDSSPKYINLHIDQPNEAFIAKLDELGVQSGQRIIAIHPAATKDYKKWPESAFKELCTLLINRGFTPALLGAGPDERQLCDRIQIAASNSAGHSPLNLCDRLNLAELAGFFRLCEGIVGNDSGPSHLASAQGVPGVVIFGPSNPIIWKPLGARSHVLRKVEQCDPRCSRRACFASYRCLHAVSPEEVLDVLETETRAGSTP